MTHGVVALLKVEAYRLSHTLHMSESIIYSILLIGASIALDYSLGYEVLRVQDILRRYKE